MNNRGTIPRILVIGDQGQVGWEVCRALTTLGEVTAVGRSTKPHRVDLTRPETLNGLIDTVRPDWIINAAAYTAVDNAESDRGNAFLVNAEAPGVLAHAAARHEALLVHYSTDYVFDGDSGEPYVEDSATNPRSVYGQSKLDGELRVTAEDGPHLILRTSWVYGYRGHNFLRTIRRLAREREELRIVSDQWGAPTSSRDIAEATAQVLAQLGTARAHWSARSGVYHLSSSGATTWFDFALRIFEHQRQHESIKAERVVPITTEQYPLPAPRPHYSALDTSKLAHAFGIHMPHWEHGLNNVLEALIQNKI